MKHSDRRYPTFRRDASPWADRPAPEPDATLSPGAIIVRAASTMPAESDETEAPIPVRPVRLDRPREPEAAAVLPRARAKRRPRRRATMLWPRLRRTAYALRWAPIIVVFGAVPLMLWQTGWFGRVFDAAGDVAGSAVREAKTSLDMRLRHISVVGAHRTPHHAVRSALGLKAGDDIANANLGQLQKQVARLPWVQSASIERRLPDTLMVRLTEYRPIARYRRGGKTILIGADGKVVSVEASPHHAALLMLSGKGAPAGAREGLVMLAKAKALHLRVRRLIRRGDRRWDVVFDNGTTLMLPEHHATEAWLRFDRIEQQHRLIDRGAEVLDMRLRDRLVIRPPAKTNEKSG